jgi:hypothetical protein
MAIQDDWTIDYGAKTVTHSSGTTIYTMLAFFQWLAAEFAASAQMDDEYPIQSDTPTVYKWLNGWYFGSEANDTQYLSGGSIESSDGNEGYANLYSIGSTEAGTQLYIVQSDAEVSPWWGTGNIDILIKVKTSGALIDSGNVLVMARESDYEYDHNFVYLGGLGRNPVGINNANDLGMDGAYGEIYLTCTDVTGFDIGNYVEDTTAGGTARINYIDTTNDYLYLVMVEGTFTGGNSVQESLTRGGTSTGTTTAFSTVTQQIASYTDISITFGSVSRDLQNGNGSQNYDVEIDCAGRSMLEVYQYLKYIARHNSATTINGDTGEEYLSANEGVYTDVKKAPFGTYAGGTFFGARGVWLTNYASADFALTDANNVLQTPPTLLKASVSNSSLSGCRVFVAEITGDGGTYTAPYTVSSFTSNTIVATASIDKSKTAQSGFIRVATPAGRDDLEFTYTGINADGVTFEGVSPDPTGTALANSDTFSTPLVSVLADAAAELSDNIIYSAPFWCRAVVRKYGFKPFAVDQQFGANGLSVNAVLTTDPQAT